jgi:hypothetical protein
MVLFVYVIRSSIIQFLKKIHSNKHMDSVTENKSSNAFFV